jgi:glycosyltransferase involved in cell wall biosynthesis
VIVTAVLAIRNEAAYLANALRHLVRNGVAFVIIDNGSSDGSAEIYRRREFAANLIDVQELPYSGAFSLAEQLARKMEIVDALDTDWVIHLDADEVMHSYRPGESLNDALSRLDAEGWNAVNFDEFVFLPVDADYVTEGPEHQPMSYYYFFEPRSPRLVRAWRKTSGLSIAASGGHMVEGPGVRLAPEHFVLRHYLARSQAHAFDKYTTREFAEAEVAIGWHRARAGQPRAAFQLPPARALQRLRDPADRDLDRSDPWTSHYWQRTF